MPYILEKDRPPYDAHIGALKDMVDKVQGSPYGHINYIITRLIVESISRRNRTRKTALSYDQLNSIVGLLECVKLELYDQVAKPYEKNKRDMNGDVYNEFR